MLKYTVYHTVPGSRGQKECLFVKYDPEHPWIKNREACLCLWKCDASRGYISDMNVSLLTDFMCFSDRQLEDYALMLKECGFTGAQVTDMCSAWRPSGSPEFVHDRFKVFADALHRNGMQFTLWCWAAEFCDHGWHDDDVVYKAEDGGRAFNDPKVHAAFEKYYDIYARMAPYADRVIAHFYDPGCLSSMDDVIDFLRLFADKFRAANPDIQIGVDTWGSPADFPEKLVSAGFEDIMLMELPFLPIWNEPGKRAEFRRGVKKLGCDLGSWGWYTCEYETDQIPFMCVNNRVIADVYRQTREQGDGVLVPSYWSEMDAYHVLNFPSIYAAGHLLIDPERDPDELLSESAALTVGDDEAEDFTYVLTLIRDARSGDTWNSYWHTESGYILRRYDAADIYKRAERAAEILRALIKKDLSSKIRMPLKTRQILKLMEPHIEQIRRFAEFRLGYERLDKMYAELGDCEEVRGLAASLSDPIPEYNCVTGLWGQPEARVQLMMLDEFSKRTGIRIPRSASRDFLFKRRFVDRITVEQRKTPGKRMWCSPYIYESGLAFGNEETAYIVSLLVDEGVLIRNEEGLVALADSESVRFDFNI